MLPVLRPITLWVVASFVLNDTKPSPDAIARVEIAPAFQPGAPVFVSVPVDADAPAVAVHVTASPRSPDSTTSAIVAPGEKSAVSTSSGYAGATPLV